jgi:hypothetical protein
MTVATVEEVEIDLPIKDLDAADRCDRCLGRAYFHAVHRDSKIDLMFCKHHGDKFSLQLSVQGFVLSDQTSKLD